MHSEPTSESVIIKKPVKDGQNGKFPLSFATGLFDFLTERSDRIAVASYADLDWRRDFDAEDGYPEEYARWCLRRKQPDWKDRALVVIQYDVDSQPARSMALLRAACGRGLATNTMIFNERIDRRHLRDTGELTYTEYELDDDLLLEACANGSEVGFHFNSMERARWDSQLASEIFEADLRELRQRFPVRFVSAHGGVAGPTGLNNYSLSLPDQRRLGVRWVHNGFTPRFDGNFSDGGLNRGKIDPDKRDLRDFIRSMKPGNRYRILLHPQYYSADSLSRPPGFVGTRWYEELFQENDSNPGFDPWKDVELAW